MVTQLHIHAYIFYFHTDPAIPPLGIYPDKTFLEKDTCTHMFIAALFTIICLFCCFLTFWDMVDEWKCKVFNIYIYIYISVCVMILYNIYIYIYTHTLWKDSSSYYIYYHFIYLLFWWEHLSSTSSKFQFTQFSVINYS